MALTEAAQRQIVARQLGCYFADMRHVAHELTGASEAVLAGRDDEAVEALQRLVSDLREQLQGLTWTIEAIEHRTGRPALWDALVSVVWEKQHAPTTPSAQGAAHGHGAPAGAQSLPQHQG